MESNRNSNTKSGGIGFCGALTLIFITLKLTNLIDWSWVWVLAPLWISLSLALIIAAIVIVVALIHNKAKFKKKR